MGYIVTAIILVVATFLFGISNAVLSSAKEKATRYVLKEEAKQEVFDGYLRNATGFRGAYLNTMCVIKFFSFIVAVAGWQIWLFVLLYNVTHDHFQLDWPLVLLIYIFVIPGGLMLVASQDMQEDDSKMFVQIGYAISFGFAGLFVAFIILVLLYYFWYFVCLGGVIDAFDSFWEKFIWFVISLSLMVSFLGFLLTRR